MGETHMCPAGHGPSLRGLVLAGALHALGYRRAGIKRVVMFHCCLRTSEGVDLQRNLQAQFDRIGRCAVLALKRPQTGQHHGVDEYATVDCA
eukprot:4169335-Pyramimonas_sp.AAC.1